MFESHHRAPEHVVNSLCTVVRNLDNLLLRVALISHEVPAGFQSETFCERLFDNRSVLVDIDLTGGSPTVLLPLLKRTPQLPRTSLANHLLYESISLPLHLPRSLKQLPYCSHFLVKPILQNSKQPLSLLCFDCGFPLLAILSCKLD